MVIPVEALYCSSTIEHLSGTCNGDCISNFQGKDSATAKWRLQFVELCAYSQCFYLNYQDSYIVSVVTWRFIATYSCYHMYIHCFNSKKMRTDLYSIIIGIR